MLATDPVPSTTYDYPCKMVQRKDLFAITAAAILHHCILVLVLCCVHLQTTCAAHSPETLGASEDVDASELARKLRAEICAANASQIQEFYREKREEENRNLSYPDPGIFCLNLPHTHTHKTLFQWSGINDEYAYPERHDAESPQMKISWFKSAVYQVIRPFSSSITLDSFTW